MIIFVIAHYDDAHTKNVSILSMTVLNKSTKFTNNALSSSAITHINYTGLNAIHQDTVIARFNKFLSYSDIWNIAMV